MSRKVRKRPLPKNKKAELKAEPVVAGKKISEHGEDLLSWSVTPVLRDRRKGFLLAACIVGFAVLVYIGYKDWFWPVVAVVLSTMSFSSFLLPNTYRLTTKGVVFKNGVTTVFKPWGGVVRYRAAPDGIYLVFKKTFRSRILGAGIFMYFGDNNKEQVTSIVEENVSK